MPFCKVTCGHFCPFPKTTDSVLNRSYCSQIASHYGCARRLWNSLGRNIWDVQWWVGDLHSGRGLVHTCTVNSLWPSDAIWRQRSGSTLAHVMACCLTAPSHFLNQCWLIISKVQWHLSEGNFTIDTSAINHLNKLENNLFSLKSPRGQWVNSDRLRIRFIICKR